jgi:arabinose-5-phosphate isomerase
MGDALAIALLEARGFTAEDFAFSHPGGALGRRLLLKVDDVMRSGEAVPRVTADTTVARALLEVSAKGLGMTTVLDGDNAWSACSRTATCVAPSTAASRSAIRASATS